MFTGIVITTGQIIVRKEIDKRHKGFRLRIGPAPAGLREGDSVAVSGVCLTAISVDERRQEFEVDVVPETLGRTTIGNWHTGTAVNLEPALRAGSPLGGHMVQGHVDATAIVTEAPSEQGVLALELAEDLDGLVPQGSAAVDGVSLTVQELAAREPGRVTALFAIIPYTLAHTTLGALAPGERVNIEADIIGKYVARAMRLAGTGPHTGDG